MIPTAHSTAIKTKSADRQSKKGSGARMNYSISTSAAQWQSRVQLILGPAGCQTYMRRSLQTAVLYAAKHTIAPRLPRLRPFQKRALLMTQVVYLLDTTALDFLSPTQKEAVLWRTEKHRVQLDEVTAWKRCKIVERDLAKLRAQFLSYIHPTRTHQQSVDRLVQDAYVRIMYCSSSTTCGRVLADFLCT